jgi:hypothetical protein
VITGFTVMVIRCGGVADIGAVSRTHVIDSTTIVLKKSRTMKKWLCR